MWPPFKVRVTVRVRVRVRASVKVRVGGIENDASEHDTTGTICEESNLSLPEG